MCSYNFWITVRVTYEELCITFLSTFFDLAKKKKLSTFIYKKKITNILNVHK